MSISTAGPSRIQQHKQPSNRYQNHFQSTGPKNFTSQELFNVEIHPQPPCDNPYEEIQPSEYPYPEEHFYPLEPENQNYQSQNFELEQNLDNNDENFLTLASNQTLT